MLTDECDFFIGVDTHTQTQTQTLVIVEACTHRVAQELALEANRLGYRRALRLARRRAPGCRVWAVEGSGSYGAGLSCFLASQGEQVREIERPRRARGRRGESDPLDAERAARERLAGSAGARPRSDADTQALRERLHGLSERRLISACSQRTGADQERAAYALALRTLACRVGGLRKEAAALEGEIQRRVQALAPQLIAQPGVGPISAACLLTAWSHRGRLRSEAAFARLAGAAPLPASSGKTVRHRLDRGGDRRLNRALHTILLTRRRLDPATLAYIERRLSQGKSEREAIRCLKRYLARSLFRLLKNPPSTP